MCFETHRAGTKARLTVIINGTYLKVCGTVNWVTLTSKWVEISLFFFWNRSRKKLIMVDERNSWMLFVITILAHRVWGNWPFLIPSFVRVWKWRDTWILQGTPEVIIIGPVIITEETEYEEGGMHCQEVRSPTILIGKKWAGGAI